MGCLLMGFHCWNSSPASDMLTPRKLSQPFIVNRRQASPPCMKQGWQHLYRTCSQWCLGLSSASGLDDSDSLPSLSDPDKWDNRMTGLKFQITRGMGDVEYQLESAIDSILKHYNKACLIARECLYKLKRFVMELCSFIPQDFQKWQHRGHAKKEAWKMTAVCVRCIFEEIHSERAVARDMYDQQDPTFTTAKFLWATWKAHHVMGSYLKHQFYEHPFHCDSLGTSSG